MRLSFLLFFVGIVLMIGSTSAFLPSFKTKNAQTILKSGPNFWESAVRFYNELVPWGDSTKGVWSGKRDAMVEKYMVKAGISREDAEKEVDEYLADREAYITRKRAEEAAQAKNQK